MLAMIVAVSSLSQAQRSATAPDTLVFINGERLSGQLERADASGVTFKSPMAGEITVKWGNIQELDSDKSFALLTRNAKITRRTAAAVVPQGSVSVADKQLRVATADGPRVVSLEQADRLVSAAEFDKAVNHPPGLLFGWGGTATGGVSLVRSTQNSTTFNGVISLVRATPLVDWLPPRSRTTLDYNQSYGMLSTPVPAVAATPTSPAVPASVSTVKTNIFHAALERDQYFSPRVYAFGSVTFDHNFSQLLDLQQAYGGGLGISLIRNAVRQLDFKGDAHYEKQTFFALPAVPPVAAQATQNLFGSTFSEKFLDYLPKGLVFNEFGSISPSWNVLNAYSAHVNADLGFPVYKGLGFSLGAVDDYLNNAPAGSKKNSTQFTTGITYTIRPR